MPRATGDSPAPGRPEVVVASAAAVERAAELLRSGEVVGYPTETAYGLAVDALAPAAVERLAALKGRHAGQYFSVLVTHSAMLDQVATLPNAARRLTDAHWPGPLTLVLPARPSLPGALVNEQGGVGVRVSPDPVASALARAFGGPITATSANLTGQPVAEVAAGAALPGVALVLDDGPRRAAVSTVVAVAADGQLTVLRRGPIEVAPASEGVP